MVAKIIVVLGVALVVFLVGAFLGIGAQAARTIKNDPLGVFVAGLISSGGMLAFAFFMAADLQQMVGVPISVSTPLAGLVMMVGCTIGILSDI